MLPVSPGVHFALLDLEQQRMVHRHVDRADDKAANSVFSIEVHVFPPLGVEMRHPIILYRPIMRRPQGRECGAMNPTGAD
jgi:prolyl-tRNA editing enzyme YbaK/EbsC (Cys-tRNA(Pro) deacylase)